MTSHRQMLAGKVARFAAVAWNYRVRLLEVALVVLMVWAVWKKLSYHALAPAYDENGLPN